MPTRLAPGLHVLRRADGRLQVGLGRDRAVLLPDTDDVRQQLEELAAGRLQGLGAELGILEALLAAGPRAEPGRVRVTGFGHPAGSPMADRLRALLTRDRLTRGRERADVVVLAGAGEPPRSLADRCVRSETPYLLVRMVEGSAVVGPFVEPGVTACLRCIDAAYTAADPSWPLLLEQYVRASARDRPDGSSEPVDPMLAELVCAWAARDVVTYLRGGEPATWSRSVRFDAQLAVVEATHWLRHPGCGCMWTIDP